VHPIYRTGVPLPSRCCILYIFFSTNISVEYFKHAAHSPFFSSKCHLFHNATFFGTCIIHILHTGVLKFKCKTPVPKGQFRIFRFKQDHAIRRKRTSATFIPYLFFYDKRRGFVLIQISWAPVIHYARLSFCKPTFLICGLGSVVGIATGYGLDGPGIESRWGARFSAPVQTGPGAHPASCKMGTGSFPGVKSGRGVTLTPHPLLVPLVMKE
jgi:hypothetical protein